LSEAAIVRAVAEKTASRMTRKVISALRRMRHTLSGDDSELKTTWDEICAQVQYEKSLDWDAYDLTVRSLLSAYVEELEQHEREAVWLQTDAGTDWDCEEPTEREPYPVVYDEIVDYLLLQYVYAEAGRFSNARIRTFIDRSSMRD
jgi:hypothetical protein